MPYEIAKKGSKYVVRKKDGGRVLGTHPTRAAAARQMRAVYANEGKPKGKK